MGQKRSMMERSLNYQGLQCGQSFYLKSQEKKDPMPATMLRLFMRIKSNFSKYVLNEVLNCVYPNIDIPQPKSGGLMLGVRARGC